MAVPRRRGADRIQEHEGEHRDAWDGCNQATFHELSADQLPARMDVKSKPPDPLSQVSLSRMIACAGKFWVLHSHAGQLSDRGADRKYFDQARSEFDDVGLDADHFLGAEPPPPRSSFVRIHARAHRK